VSEDAGGQSLGHLYSRTPEHQNTEVD